MFNGKPAPFVWIGLLFANCYCSADTLSSQQQPQSSIPMPSDTLKSTQFTVQDVIAVGIKLDIAGKQALFIMLSEDGAINRLGTGSEGNTENAMYISVASPDLLRRLRDQLEPKALEWRGKFARPQITGAACRLRLSLMMAGGQEISSDWEYGTRTIGPPPEIRRFVIAAVEATDGWYYEQKRQAAQKRK